MRLVDVKFRYAVESRQFHFPRLHIDSGETLAVVGRSGVGKTTLLNLIAGIAGPQSGNLDIDGLSAHAFRETGRLGMVFQSPSLLPWRTVFGNIVLPLQLRKVVADVDHIERLLHLTNLGSDRNLYPDQLSGGMKSRVALCRALATSPTLLLMDEPFGDLDEVTRLRLLDEFISLRSQFGFTTVIVTHNIAEAIYLGDRVAVVCNSHSTGGEEVDLNEIPVTISDWDNYQSMLTSQGFRPTFSSILSAIGE